MRSECGNGALHNTVPLCYIAGKACSTVSKRTLPHCGMKPQLKRGVEHDCYIYTWNSACTMEGIDITMVWNSLLNNLRCGLKCAVRLLFAVLVKGTWEFTAAATCRRVHGKNSQGLEPLYHKKRTVPLFPGPGCSGLNKPDSGDGAGGFLYIRLHRLERDAEADV